MKICLIGGIYGKGGLPTNYLKITPETTLAKGFRERGYDVTTVSHYDEADFRRFDIVHVHHLSWGALRMASDRSTTPMVFTPHDTSHMDGLPLSSRWKAAMRYVIRAADATVGLSRLEGARQKDVYGSQGLHATIPNGIDTSKYNYLRANTRGQGRPWQLLFSAQLIPMKRCDVLLRAVAALKPDVELSLVYQNPQLERELKTLAVALGIESRVRFLGKLPPERLGEMYQRSDILVLPSATEALPSVVTEAMLCGLPFIASAVGGVREQAAGFGYLLERKEVEDVVAAITHVISRYDAYHDASRRMSDHARSTYSIESMITRHLELYGKLREIHSPRRHTATFCGLHHVARTVAKRFGQGRSRPTTARPAEA